MAGEQTIAKFTEQFAWEPILLQGEKLGKHSVFVVCGVGGSQLGPMLIQSTEPAGTFMLHRDYGLPTLSPETEASALVILSSYSGTTEETLDSAHTALSKGMSMAAVSTGGELLEFAKANGIPYVEIPETGLQPRLATGFSMLSIARVMNDAGLESRIRESGKMLDVQVHRDQGLELAQKLQGKVPLIYTSVPNAPIGYIWKIKINETSKIPAFCNVVPEFCHNEINGLDLVDSTRPLAEKMHVIMLEDDSDEERNRKRMRVAGEIFEERGLAVSRVKLQGDGFKKALDSSVMADWVSYSLASYYGVPDEATPLIAEFKRRIAA